MELRICHRADFLRANWKISARLPEQNALWLI
jgi:hypothetical protein